MENVADNGRSEGAPEEPVRKLTAEECWQRLQTHQLGRLVTRVGDVLDIFPVNYVIDGESIVFRTAEGTKLSQVAINDSVLFEVDEYNVMDAWSVVVRGSAAVIDTSDGIAAAERLPLQPMVPTIKWNFVRVVPGRQDGAVSGRFFDRGPEPDRYEALLY
ncbi:pyridoxamine 5'-phosphate oxidase family protein [Leucobacter sp. GX24907]